MSKPYWLIRLEHDWGWLSVGDWLRLIFSVVLALSPIILLGLLCYLVARQ